MALGFAGLLTACATTAPSQTWPDIALAGTRIFPESITSDSLGNIYIGSNQGTIYRAQAGDSQAQPWIAPNAENGLQQVFGVFADEMRGTLWVCSNPGQQQSGAATLKAFALASGQLTGSYPFPGEGRALCNDIAIDAGGTVYATDTIGGRIVTLLPGASALTEFAASEEMRGIDGIAVGGNGDLYINNVQRNLLQRVERSDGDFSGLTTLVTTLPLSGPDGLRSIGGNRFLQAEGNGGRVALLTVDGDKVDMQTIVSGLDYPAAVTLVGKVAFVSEGKIGYLIDPAKRGQDPGTFTIHAVEFE